MWYLSALLKHPVVDSDGVVPGKLVEVVAPSPAHARLPVLIMRAFPDAAPSLLALIVETPQRRQRRLSLAQVESGIPGQIRLRLKEQDLVTDVPQPGEVWLREQVLNREVVDLAHKRVVRVNDVQVDEDWRLLGLDGSPLGLLHWLVPSGLWKWLARQVKSGVVPWGQVELLPQSVPARLSVSGALPAVEPLALEAWHPAEIAEVVQRLSLHEGRELLAALEVNHAAATLAELAPVDQAILLGVK